MNTKQFILQEGFKLFLQKNYKEVTLSEIVNITGLSKGAFYHYFKSKEELFLQIVESFFETINSFDFESLPTNSFLNFYTVYSERISNYQFDFIESESQNSDEIIDANFFSLLFDAFRLFPDFREKMKLYHQKELVVWANVIGNAQTNGELKSNISDIQMAQLFLLSGDGLALNQIIVGGKDEIIQNVKSVWDAIYEVVRK